MPKQGYLVRLVSFVLSLLLLSQPLSALASTPPISEEPPAAESTKNDPRHFGGVSTVDSLTSPPSFDFTDGVSTGAGFSFGDGLSSIRQTYSDELTMPPYLSFGRFIYDRTDGSSIQYQIQNSSIKEEIVLNSKPDTNTISFELKLGTSTLRKEADGYHVISDAAEDLYTILNPNVRDAAGKTGEIFMDVAGSRATLTVNADFLARASYPVVIDPTTVASGAARTGFAMQRKIFWDGNRYFLFYSNGTNFYYRSSHDGITWSAATLAFAGVQGRDLAIWNNGADVYAAYVTSTYDITVRKGTISDDSISWGTANTALDGTSATNRYDIPGITRDSSGKLWLSSRMLSGDRYVVKAVRSTYADDPSAWGTVSTLSTTGNTSSSLFPSAAPLDNGKMLFFWNRGTTYEARYFDGSAFGSVMTVGSSPSTESDTYAPTAVVDQTGKVYMGYINSSIKASYKTLISPYNSGALSDESVFSNSEAGYVSLSLDSLGGEVYGFYANSLGGLENEVRMKRLSDGAEVQLSDTANRGFDEVKVYRSGGGWTLDTTDAADNDSPGDVHGDTNYLLTQAADALQVADKDKFERVAIKLSQTATGVTSLVVKYWNGSAWATLSFTDGTANLAVTDGAISFTPPSDWAKDSSGLYAVQIKTANTPTQKPIGSVVNNFPLSRYVSSPYSVQGRPYAFWMDGQNSESFSIKYAQAQTSGSLAGASRAPQVTEDMKTASLAVNAANGNAAVSFGDLSTPARGFAAGLAHVYNSRAGADSPYGYNWSLAPEESLDTRNPDGSLSYHSSDGHISRFDLVSGSYVAEKGLYLTLTKNGDGTYTLKDKGNNLTNFSSSGVLSTRADRNGNTTTYAHDSYGRLTSITDSAAQVTTLTYQSGAAGRLSSISAPGSRSMSYTYNSSTGDLLSYTNAENETTSFAYTSHQMTRVTDPKGGVYNLIYTKSRLTKIERPAVMLDGEMTVTSQNIAYNEADTKVTDPNGNSSTYATSPFGDGVGAIDADKRLSSSSFDAAGNPVSTLAHKDKSYEDNVDTDTASRYSWSGSGSVSWDSAGQYFELITGNSVSKSLTVPAESTESARLQADVYTKAKYTDPGTYELTLRQKTNGDYYKVTIPVDSLAAKIEKKVSGATTILASSPNVRVREGVSGGASDRWHTIAAEADTSTISAYLDGKKIFEVHDTAITGGGDFSLTVNQARAYVDNIRLYQGAMATRAGYDPSGNKTSETDALSQSRSYVYTANNLTRETNERSYTTNYTYDDNGNRLTQTDALSNTTNYLYDTENGDLLREIDPRGYQTNYTYWSNGLQKDVLAPEGVATYHEYEVAGNETTTTKKMDIFLSDFEKDQGWVGGSADATGTKDGVQGQNISSSGATTETVLSKSIDWQTRYRAGSEGSLSFWVYLDNPSAVDTTTSEVLLDSTGSNLSNYYHASWASGQSLTSGWNKVSIPRSSFSASGDPSWADLKRTVLRLKSISGSTVAIFDALKISSAYHVSQIAGYDNLGRTTSTTDAKGATTSYIYDDNGNKTDEQTSASTKTYGYDALSRLEGIAIADTTQSSFVYDAKGNRTVETDGNQDSTLFIYDSLNRVTEEMSADESVVSFTYDAVGNKITEKHGEADHTINSYDILGNLLSVTDPNHKTTAYEYVAGNKTKVQPPLGNPTINTYDHLDRLETAIDGGGVEVDYGYDASGNETTETHVSESKVATNTYDGSNNVLTSTDLEGTTTVLAFDVAGSQISESKPNFSLYSTYDENGQEIRTVDSNGAIKNGNSDPGGRPSETRNENGKVTYGYDDTDRLTGLRVEGEATTTISNDSAGNRTGLGQANGVNTAYVPDEAGKLIGIETSSTAGTIFSAGYEYDTKGNITTETVGTATTVYGYDGNNQLTNWTDLASQEATYTYDANGNRQSLINSAGTTSYGYDVNTNQLASLTSPGVSVSYTYDPGGNLATRTDAGGTTTYTWDGRNELTGISGPGIDASYTYDTKGRRLSKTVNGVTTGFVYDGINLIAEKDSSGTVTAKYFYDGTGRLLSMKKNGHSYYFHVNGRGDVVKVTDEAMNVVASYLYEPWGNILESTGSFADEQPFRYAGYYRDAETGFFYLIARYYDAEVGRFISPDSFPDLEEEGASNRYTYVANNPVMRDDQSGLHYRIIAKAHWMTAYASVRLYYAYWSHNVTWRQVWKVSGGFPSFEWGGHKIFALSGVVIKQYADVWLKARIKSRSLTTNTTYDTGWYNYGRKVQVYRHLVRGYFPLGGYYSAYWYHAPTGIPWGWGDGNGWKWL